jgi:hypothetical protein
MTSHIDRLKASIRHLTLVQPDRDGPAAAVRRNHHDSIAAHPGWLAEKPERVGLTLV